MGVVWRATQVALNRPVALKAIAPQLAQDEAFRERFQHESLLAASIDHPNVIPVYEAGELDGTLFLIMRWVDGTDLRARLDTDGGQTPSRTIRLLRPVASALAAAHRRGLIHRDIKPANVLIAAADDEGDEHVYLTDFGIAQRTESRGMTRTGVLVGTLDYMAPERIEGGRGTPASDIYAFGCMLYETLSGRVPFDRPTGLAKMHAHINDPVPVDGLPASMAPIVMRAMAKRPEDRYGSAAELVAALDDARKPTAPTDLPTQLSTPPPTDPGATVLAPDPDKTAMAPDADQTAMAPDASNSDPTRLVPETAETPPAPAAVPRRQPDPSPTPVSPPPTQPRAPEPPSRSANRRTPVLLGLLVLVLVVVVVLVVTSGGGSSGTTVKATVVSGSGITVHTSETLPDAPVALAPDTADTWGATRDRLFQIAAAGGTQIANQKPSPGPAAALGVDARGRVWVVGAGGNGVAHQAQSNVIATGAGTNLLALDSQAGWVAARGTSTVTRVDLRSLSGAPESVTGQIGAFGTAFGRLWVASDDGHVTVLDADGHHDALDAPDVEPGTVGVVPSNGVWFVSSRGALNLIDPRLSINGQPVTGHYVEHAVNRRVSGGASAVGAWPGTNAIWVLSPGSKSLVEIATGGSRNGKIIAKVTFSATPGHLAVGDHVVWVDIPSAKAVIPISY